MGTPICDFVRRYAAEKPARLHMPGHKGSGDLGELRDITEIDGADDLFAPHGIIAESEENASRLFGARTLYSAGGSTLCVSHGACGDRKRKNAHCPCGQKCAQGVCACRCAAAYRGAVDLS